MNRVHHGAPSQLDYVIVSQRWKTATSGVGVRWGLSDLRWGRRYDHGLIQFIWAIRLRKKKAPLRLQVQVLISRPTTAAVKTTQQALRRNFEQAVQRRLPADIGSGNEGWKDLCNALNSAAEEVLEKQTQGANVQAPHVS